MYLTNMVIIDKRRFATAIGRMNAFYMPVSPDISKNPDYSLRTLCLCGE